MALAEQSITECVFHESVELVKSDWNDAQELLRGPLKGALVHYAR